MPYFQWQGITLHGTIKKGKQGARSATDLSEQLFKRDIALLSSKQIAYPRLNRITKKLIYDFFYQLSTLLQSGILLPQALALLAYRTKNPQFQDILFALVDDVHQGNSLYDALKRYPVYFDPLILNMVRVGQEIGSLDQTLIIIINHQKMIDNFQKQLRSAAIMPCITLLFFCASAATIFLIILPRFASLFASMHQQLPPLTRKLLAVSDFLQSVYALIFFACAGVLIGCCSIYVRSARGKQHKDYYLLKVPVVGNLIEQQNMVQWLRSLALLLKGGMQLVPALHIAQHALKNRELKRSCGQLIQQVEAGNALSAAMAYQENLFFNDELIALLFVGEESNTLDTMLSQAAALYESQMQRTLTFITLLLQPLLLIIIGLLITALIFAVYVPIFSMATIIA